MRTLLLTATLLAGLPLAANAVQVISFGQTSGTNTVVATANAGGTATTIDITDATVLIDQILGIATPPAIPAFLDLTATSIDSATLVGGTQVLQHYDGTFSITSGAGDTGTNYLSGSFSDAAFGAATGSQLSVNVANPPDTLSVTSDVISPTGLGPPSSLTFALSNVTPALALDNLTIGSFGASFAGTANATANVPEPASLLMLGVGMLAIGVVRRVGGRR